MAEELQGLLDRIQKDGVEKAEAEAARIIEEAKTKAAGIVSAAEDEADGLLRRAEEEGKLFEERGRSAIAQAARDVVLSVGDAITSTLKGIVTARVDAAFDTEDFPALVRSAVEAYCSADSVSGIEVLVSESQQEQVRAYFMREMAEQMQAGLAIKGDKGIVSGFLVSIKDSGIQHDFTGTALTDALCSLLRPQLAQIVKEAMPDN
jgi:V/A-type H+-transporting ATPase subunit E